MFVLQSSCRCASEMKVFVLTVVCALVEAARGGAVAWPGAVPVSFSSYSSSVLPTQARGVAYSTSQYMNAIPSSPTFGYQPQIAYQLPQNGAFPSIAYQPIPSAHYFPQSHFLYPQITPIASISPAIPATPAYPAIPAIPASPALPAIPVSQQPAETPSSQPTQQPAGDEDSTVVESAAFPAQQQQQNIQQTPTSQSDISSQPQFPQYQPLFTPQSQTPLGGTQEAESMPPQSEQPAFPQFPQFPQLPQFPPQLPQFPGFPSNPLFPQTTTPPPASPPADSDSKGFNDKDSISVESA